MDVRNISDEELNIGKKLMSHTDLQVMPIGIVEVGEVLTNYTKILNYSRVRKKRLL